MESLTTAELVGDNSAEALTEPPTISPDELAENEVVVSSSSVPLPEVSTVELVESEINMPDSVVSPTIPANDELTAENGVKEPLPIETSSAISTVEIASVVSPRNTGSSNIAASEATPRAIRSDEYVADSPGAEATAVVQAEPSSEPKVEPGAPADPPTVVVVKPIVRLPIITQKSDIVDKRQLTGIRPIVPLRKRGQSFRETSKMISTVDADGRRHLNQYTFIEELGRGAYGVVFKVECSETKQMFAAKTVDKKALKRVRVGRFGNALQSVKKELNIWKRLKHRHLVMLREVIDTDDSDELFMISELVDGGPVLDDDIECTPLNAELTKTYFTHLIEGIDFLHENKIIHRDIKPGNLLLKTVDDNEVILKIADFGVSHELESDTETLRQTAGTAIFMAPEMLTGESFQGKPVDIWACGITLYMFVYGHPPFIADTMTELYKKIQNDPIEYPTNVGDRIVEDDLVVLLKHVLEKDPKKRYTSHQIRAHPWAWREFQVSAIKCVTHPEGRRLSFTKSLSGVAAVSKSMRSLFSRPSAVFPGGTTRSSLPAIMAGLQQYPPQ